MLSYGCEKSGLARTALPDGATTGHTVRRVHADPRVAAVTYEKKGVNGRTILDTCNDRPEAMMPGNGNPSAERLMRRIRRALTARRFRPVGVGLLLFLAALAMELAMNPAILPEDSLWAEVTTALAPLLFPALWGGIGACTFQGALL